MQTRSIFLLTCILSLWSTSSFAGSFSADLSDGNAIVSILGAPQNSLAADLAALIMADESATSEQVEEVVFTNGDLGSCGEYDGEVSVTLELLGDLLAVGGNGEGNHRIFVVGGVYAEKLSTALKVTGITNATYPHITCIERETPGIECLLTDTE